MTCERYWREGILLVEQGRPDPHRETCLDCRREHEARRELVRAFALVGASAGRDPRWQARVWRQIANDEAPQRTWGPWAGALAAAAALLLFVWTQGLLARDTAPGEAADRPRYEIIPSKTVVRSGSLSLGDRVRFSVGVGHEARIYRAEALVLRCTAAAPGCARSGHGLTAELTFDRPGDYKLISIPAGLAEPAGTLDADLAAITTAGGAYQILSQLTVR